MRIVSFGDIHMSLHTIDRLAPELEQADLVIVSGDLTNFGGRDDAEQVVVAVERHTRQVLAVSGNLDQREVMDFLRERGISLHGESRRIGDLGIFGCGGSNLTPFRTPTEFSDEDLGALLDRGYNQVSDAPHVLMVCHTPPAEHGDRPHLHRPTRRQSDGACLHREASARGVHHRPHPRIRRRRPHRPHDRRQRRPLARRRLHRRLTRRQRPERRAEAPVSRRPFADACKGWSALCKSLHRAECATTARRQFSAA